MAYIDEFRQLFHELTQCNTAYESRKVLETWLRYSAKLVQKLEHHRHFDATFNFERDDLCSWYALSRVNDLLLPYRPPERTQYGWDVPILPEFEYSNFWSDLDFTLFHPVDYHPFWCEIAEVETDENPDAAPEVIEWLWPGLQFGDMVFSRAGVRVRSGSKSLDAEIATTSPLYFSYIRPHRKTQDLSMGWGSNSQWSTDFRRDYVCGEHLLLNVDGQFDFDQPPYPKFPPFLRGFDFSHMKYHFFKSSVGDDYGLTDRERAELLVNRCFVHSRKPDTDYWPYDDCLVVRRDVALW